MDTSDNVDISTDGSSLLLDGLKPFPNLSTATICSNMELVCPNLSYLNIADFRQSLELYIKRFENDRFIYSILLNSLYAIDWEFVGNYIKEQQNV